MNYLRYDPQDFKEFYEKQAFFLKHELVNHPLFSIENLIEASNRLPDQNIEQNSGDVPISELSKVDPKQRLTPEQTIRQITECQSWLGLLRIEQLPEYKQVMDELLDSVKPAVDKAFPGMYERQAFVFITSPNSTVPYHMDPEHNFLLQIQGEKHFTIFDKSDRELVSELDIEHHCVQPHRKLILKDEHKNRGQLKVLKPGDAMHVPICAPHYVQNTNEISISLSITFYTPAAVRRTTIYEINHKLRNMKTNPTPYGQNPWKDNLKFNSWKQYMRLKRLAGK